MRTGILCAAAIAAAAPIVSAAPTWSYLAGGDAAFLGLTDNGALEQAVTEGRIGNNALNGAWELAVWELGAVGTPKDQAQATFTNDVAIPFELSWNGVDTVTYTVGGTTVSWGSVGGSFTDIFIRARAGSSSVVDLTDLDLAGSGLSIGDLTAHDEAAYLRISNMDQAFGAFTLTGNQRFQWTGSRPNNSALAYQIKMTNVIPAPGAAALEGLAGFAGLRRCR